MAIEDLEQDEGLIYRQLGQKGLETIPNVGSRLVEVVKGLLAELSVSPEGCGRSSRCAGWHPFAKLRSALLGTGKFRLSVYPLFRGKVTHRLSLC